MTPGASWTTDSVVSGVAQGTPVAYNETYDTRIDATGDLSTPFGLFPTVMRVQTTLTRTIGLVVDTIQSFAFVADCAGTIAKISSQDYETEVEFTQAVEVQRLAP
jgi:hypothetical protein